MNSPNYRNEESVADVRLLAEDCPFTPQLYFIISPQPYQLYDDPHHLRGHPIPFLFHFFALHSILCMPPIAAISRAFAVC
jgi:hypothetical protein